MLLSQLEYFVAIVETGSFSGAAERCHISQSAISQQIKSLESELGVLLLERHNRTFSLTPSGEYFYAKSVILLSDLNNIQKETIRIAKDKNSHLNIGCLSSYQGDELTHAMELFQNKHPEIDIHVTLATHDRIFNGLRDGSLDIILNDQRRAFSDLYRNTVLTKKPLYLAVSPHHPLAVLSSIEISDLKNTPIIILSEKEQEAVERAYYTDIFGFKGEPVFARSMQEAKMMVTATRGVLLYDGKEEKSFHCIPITSNNNPLTETLCAFSKSNTDNPYIEEFDILLKEQFI